MDPAVAISALAGTVATLSVFIAAMFKEQEKRLREDRDEWKALAKKATDALEELSRGAITKRTRQS